MPRLTPADHLNTFSAAYGRFCAVAAQALHARAAADAEDRAAANAVRNAMSAKALGPVPADLMPIRDRRREWSEAYRIAKEAGVQTLDILNRMRLIHTAVAGEWNVDLPVARD